MALLRYMPVLPRHGELHDPTGPLSSLLPSSMIEEANAAVTSDRQEDATKGKRGPNLKLSNEIKAKIGTMNRSATAS